MNTQVSVIVVSLNVKDFLKKCLSDLEKEKKLIDLEIIVVDNASDDGTREFLRDVEARENGTLVLYNDENRGFARACNQGARKADGSYLLFLNPDTWIPSGSVRAMAEHLDLNREVGVLGPRILYPDGSLQYTCGPRLKLRYSICESFRLWYLSRVLFGGSHYMTWDHDHPRDVGWVSGGCLMVPRDLFIEEGMFDERFFVYTEDMDLCLRLNDRGHRILYWPRVHIVHAEAQTARNIRSSALLRRYQSRLYYFKKHHGDLMSFIHRFLFSFASFLEAVLAFILHPVRSDKNLLEIAKAHMNAAFRVWSLRVPDPGPRCRGDAGE